jgi:hypothetical protein
MFVVKGLITKPNHKRSLSTNKIINVIGIKMLSVMPQRISFELNGIETDADTNDAYLIDDRQATIYQLVCNDESVKDVHIGHTVMELEEVMTNHRLICQNTNAKRYDSYLYKQIRANGGWDNWHHEILEICISIDKETVLKREREWIEKTPNAMNVLRPISSSEEENDTYNKELMKVVYTEADFHKKKRKMREQNLAYRVSYKDEIKEEEDYNEVDKDKDKGRERQAHRGANKRNNSMSDDY